MEKGGCAEVQPFSDYMTGLYKREDMIVKKMLFIYNPNAGTGTLKPNLSDVIDVFTKAGYEVTV